MPVTQVTDQGLNSEREGGATVAVTKPHLGVLASYSGASKSAARSTIHIDRDKPHCYVLNHIKNIRHPETPPQLRRQRFSDSVRRLVIQQASTKLPIEPESFSFQLTFPNKPYVLRSLITSLTSSTSMTCSSPANP